MPILQQKLVMKSIEALHDEALLLVPDTAGNHGVNAPSTVVPAATPLQELPTAAPSGTSANAAPDTAGDHDIMARIDHLLKKLNNDDDVAAATLADEGPKLNARNMTSNPINTVTADNSAIDNLANPESPVLSNAVDYANENAKLDVAEDGTVEDRAGNPFGETDDDANDDMFLDDQSGKTVPSDQAQALADIAEAIYQAGQQAVDTVVLDANQNTTVPVDMAVLSATVADEVRRTVSAVMIAELPQMVRDAVSEAIRSFPADARGQSTPTTVNPSTAKSVTTRKTATAKKTVAKKARTKKAGSKKRPQKKATDKTAPST